MSCVIIHDIAQSAVQVIERHLVSSNHGTFGTVAVCLVLTGDDRHQVFIILHEHYLRVVHAQIHRVETALHLTIEMQRLSRGLQVCQQNTMTNEMLFTEVVEAIQERFRGTEGADVHISTPGLLKNPVLETERMKSSTQIALRGALIQWLEYRRYVPAPAHLNQKSRI